MFELAEKHFISYDDLEYNKRFIICRKLFRQQVSVFLRGLLSWYIFSYDSTMFRNSVRKNSCVSHWVILTVFGLLGGLMWNNGLVPSFLDGITKINNSSQASYSLWNHWWLKILADRCRTSFMKILFGSLQSRLVCWLIWLAGWVLAGIVFFTF